MVSALDYQARLLCDDSNSLTYGPRKGAKSITFTCQLCDCTSFADWLFTVRRRSGSVYLGLVVLGVCEVCYVYEGYVGSAVVLYN